MRFIVQLAFVVAAIGSGCQAYYSRTGTKLTVEPILGSSKNQQLQQCINGTTKHGWKLGTTHQRIILFNVYHNAPLGAFDNFGYKRRNVAVEKAPFDDSGNFSRMIEWRLVPLVDGKYAIIHHHYNEPLYAYDCGTCYENFRHVLTWLTGYDDGDMQYRWEIIPRSDGRYLIKSVLFSEYLMGTDFPSKEKVFTWRNGSADLEDRKFHWDIININ